MEQRYQNLRLLLVVIALALGVIAISQLHNDTSAPKANGSVAATGQVAAQTRPELKLAANARPAAPAASPSTNGSLACSLLSDTDVMPIVGVNMVGPTVSTSSMNQDQTCLWDGPNSTVGADILSQVPAGNTTAVDAAFQAQYRFSVHYAAISPTLGETVTMLPGKANAYMIQDTATHSLAVVTARPDLGLVVRYTTAKDTPLNEQILEAWAA